MSQLITELTPFTTLLAVRMQLLGGKLQYFLTSLYQVLGVPDRLVSISVQTGIHGYGL